MSEDFTSFLIGEVAACKNIIFNTLISTLLMAYTISTDCSHLYKTIAYVLGQKFNKMLQRLRVFISLFFLLTN